MDWFLYDNGLRHEGVDLGCNDLLILWIVESDLQFTFFKT